MNIFKPITLKWWQGSIFKISMLSGGIAIGAYFSNFFLPYLIPLWIVAVICGIYVTYVWVKE